MGFTEISLNLDIDELSLICSSLEYCINYSDASFRLRKKLIKLLDKIDTVTDI